MTAAKTCSKRGRKKNDEDALDYGISSIPTQYRGIWYRSRLEAKWAAFFDEMKWRYQYEPVEFQMWSPDFVLIGATNTFVEVKPITGRHEKVESKLLSSCCRDEMMVVGLCPKFNLDGEPSLVGWLAEDRSFGDAVFAHDKNEYSKIGFRSLDMDWTDRIYGGHAKHIACGGVVGGFWANACNTVQYQKEEWNQQSMQTKGLNK